MNPETQVDAVTPTDFRMPSLERAVQHFGVDIASHELINRPGWLLGVVEYADGDVVVVRPHAGATETRLRVERVGRSGSTPVNRYGRRLPEQLLRRMYAQLAAEELRKCCDWNATVDVLVAMNPKHLFDNPALAMRVIPELLESRRPRSSKDSVRRAAGLLKALHELNKMVCHL